MVGFPKSERSTWEGPLDSSALGEATLLNRQNADHPRRGRLLVAEDDHSIRSLLQAILSRHWDVEAVADGQQALDSLRRGKPDLLLTDINMPQVDGLDLVRAIRAVLSHRDLPVIVMSARDGDASRLESLAAGADDYLAKPFVGRELVARIRMAIAIASARLVGTET